MHTQYKFQFEVLVFKNLTAAAVYTCGKHTCHISCELSLITLKRTVTQFVSVSRSRQAHRVQTPFLIEIDLHPFPDDTNTSVLIAAINWRVKVIALRLAIKWPKRQHSSIFSDIPKVMLTCQLMHIQARFVNVCSIHLCRLSGVFPPASVSLH